MRESEQDLNRVAFRMHGRGCDVCREREADVIVYTATAAGVAVSVAAARMGVRVFLLEPGRHVGGMLSGGLSHSDVLGQQDLIGGITAEIYRRIAGHYGGLEINGGFDFEPHVAEETLLTMLDEAGVSLVYGVELQRVDKRGSRLTALQGSDGYTYRGKVFVDAGYEGDLMAGAGVGSVIGREGRDAWGESLAGRTELLPGHHQFRAAVSPWGEDGRLLPFITPQEDFGPSGAADGKFQSYCYRLCLTDSASNRIPIVEPERYDPAGYELLRRYFQAGGLNRLPFGMARIPNGKTDVNSGGPVSTNLPGACWEYPEASPERRLALCELHCSWAHGMLWFLQQDPSVPAAVREDARRWGLCKDEFVDTGGWPHQLYIREGRRMCGEYFVTQRDLETQRDKLDSIGVCGYNIDIREVQWVSIQTFNFERQDIIRENPRLADRVYMEGYLSQPVYPWQIPYRAVTPKLGECDNLLVPVCASMSTIAFGSFRMEPNYMIAGAAAGTAAAMAASFKQAVQDVDVHALQGALSDQGQILADPRRQSPG